MQDKIDSLIGKKVIVFSNITPTFCIHGTLRKSGSFISVSDDNEKSYSYFSLQNILHIFVEDEITYIEVYEVD